MSGLQSDFLTSALQSTLSRKSRVRAMLDCRHAPHIWRWNAASRITHATDHPFTSPCRSVAAGAVDGMRISSYLTVCRQDTSE